MAMMEVSALGRIQGEMAAARPAQAGLLAQLGLAARSGKIDTAQVEQAGRDFESMFVSQMLEQMFGESIGNEAFGDDDSNEVYKGLMVQEYGKIIADGGGIGIAQYITTQVQRELLKLQEM